MFWYNCSLQKLNLKTLTCCLSSRVEFQPSFRTARLRASTSLQTCHGLNVSVFLETDMPETRRSSSLDYCLRHPPWKDRSRLAWHVLHHQRRCCLASDLWKLYLFCASLLKPTGFLPNKILQYLHWIGVLFRDYDSCFHLGHIQAVKTVFQVFEMHILDQR